MCQTQQEVGQFEFDARLGDSHSSYFFYLLLHDSSDRLQIWRASTRPLDDQKLSYDFPYVKRFGCQVAAKFDVSPKKTQKTKVLLLGHDKSDRHKTCWVWS